MKNNFKIKIFLLISLIVFSGFANFVQADASLLIEENIILKNQCEVEDTNGIKHIFPEDGSTDEYLAVCALAEALEQNFVNNIEFVDFGFGLFVNSINGIAPENSYWKLHLNTLGADVGVVQLSLKVGDVVSFILTAFDPVTFEEEALGDSLTLTIEALDPVLSDNDEDVVIPASGGFVYKTPPLSIPRAIDYLKDAHQIYRADTDSDLYTDWATIAYSAAGILDDVHDLVFSNLKNYNIPSSLLTDNERRTMVLLSIGENPYSFSGVNYVKIITDDFDGVQFGDNFWVNDDIFALIPLASVGYTSDDDIIIKDVAFVLSRQNQGNGSWENSVDLTAAAIQALFPFKSIPGVSVAISNASNYLQNMQRENGGWESVYATSWAMQAMTTLNVLWSRGGQGPIEYFNSQQAEDGAILLSETSVKNKMWATSYVIPAVLGKPWSSIFKKFPKMIENENPEKNIINVEKLNQKVITKQELTDLELAPQTLTASVIESNILVNKQSFLKTAGLDVLNFIQNGIHQLSRLFSF
jgi:hypothetical protein